MIWLQQPDMLLLGTITSGRYHWIFPAVGQWMWDLARTRRYILLLLNSLKYLLNLGYTDIHVVSAEVFKWI